jgi:hypothetical protein
MARHCVWSHPCPAIHGRAFVRITSNARDACGLTLADQMAFLKHQLPKNPRGTSILS